MKQFYFVNGKFTTLSGTHDEILDRIRELRADGATVKQAKEPRYITPRTMARASSHRR
jgi:hypothetical protein